MKGYNMEKNEIKKELEKYQKNTIDLWRSL